MPLSSQRQRFTIFVSPKNEDFLFYEKVDKQRVQEEIPNYGDPHPDYRKYPNHFFAQAIQADEEGQVYYYYYAAKRASQDEYNWEHTTVDYRNIQYDLVERTYVTLRSEYDEDSPALASAMPVTDGDPFEEADGYILTSRQQLRIGDAGRRSTKIGDKELDSMFVLEKRFYIKRVPLTTTVYDEDKGNHIFRTTVLVHRDEVPDGASLTMGDLVDTKSDAFWAVDETTGSHKQVEQVSAEWFFVTTNVHGDANTRRVFVYVTPNQDDFVFYEVVDRLNEQNEPSPLPAYGDAHPEFTQHKFVAAVPDDKTGDFYRYYYAADRFKQDEYNFAESFLDIGGVRVSLVRRSYVTLRDSYDPDSPVVGDPMPAEPTGKFTGDYLLVDRIQRPIEDETLNSLYVSEERVYAKAPDVVGQEGNLTLQEGGLTLTRTWIVPRDEVGSFTKPAVGDPDAEYGAYKYATRRISQETPAEIDSYFSVVLDIYAKKEWAFRENHQYEIGYKLIERTTLEDDKDGAGNYSVSFDDKGWQRTQRDYELTGFEYPSQVETRPYGKITTTTSAGTEPITSANNTRSRIVFDDGTTQIYQRDVDTFEIDEGSAGQEREERPPVSILTNKYYRASGAVNTSTGSSRVIYDDGVTQVYEVREEVATAKEGPAGQTVNKTDPVTITTDSEFSTSGTVTADTGSSRVVYRGGGIIVYQVDNETAVLSNTAGGQEKEARVYADLTYERTYSLNPTITASEGTSRVVYRGGGIIVYELRQLTNVVVKESSVETKESRTFVDLTRRVSYSTSPNFSSSDGRARIVFRSGNYRVYEIDELISATLPPSARTDRSIEIQPQRWGSIRRESYYSDTDEVANGTVESGSSRVVFKATGIATIWEITEILAYPRGYTHTLDGLYETFVSDVDEDDLKVIKTETSFDYVEWTDGNQYSSEDTDFISFRQNVVYNDDRITIYECRVAKGEPKTSSESPLTYQTEVNFSWPRVLGGIELVTFCRDDEKIEKTWIPKWLRSEYNGPCRAEIEEWWDTTPPPPDANNIPFDKEMLPNDVAVDWPVFTVRTGVCLHPQVDLIWSTGLNDADRGPYKANKLYKAVFPATNYTDWPESIVANTSVQKQDGGYLMRRVRVYRPTDSETGDALVALSYPSTCN